MLDFIPFDVVFHILHYLEGRDLISLGMTNSVFNEVAKKDVLWKYLCIRRELNLIKEDGKSWKETFVSSCTYSLNHTDNQK